MSSLREGVLLRGSGAERATPYREQGPVQHPVPRESPEQQPQAQERRTTIRRAADLPVVGGGSTFRLGDVYAEELERLRQHAQAQGFAAGHAEGMEAAAAVVAETERAAAARLADVQARWERRVASAVAALGAAAARFDEATVPVADDIRDTIIGTVLTLVEDLLGRELALADSPVLDAVRRAPAPLPAAAPPPGPPHPHAPGEIPPPTPPAPPPTPRGLG